MKRPRILVTAAAGQTGSAAVRQLLAAGYPVRALVRRADGRSEALAAPASSSDGERGLSPFTIRDLVRWYEEEGDRRHRDGGVDQDALDRDLRHKLAEEYGVLPEFIAVEFERVMQAVFPGSKPRTT